MTSIPFGTAEDHATVLFDRETQVCIVVANSITYMPDALAVVRSLKAESVLIIGPIGMQRHFEELTPSTEVEVFVHVK